MQGTKLEQFEALVMLAVQWGIQKQNWRPGGGFIGVHLDGKRWVKKEPDSCSCGLGFVLGFHGVGTTPILWSQLVQILAPLEIYEGALQNFATGWDYWLEHSNSDGFRGVGSRCREYAEKLYREHMRKTRDMVKENL